MRGLILCVLVVAACGDNARPQLQDDAGIDAPADAVPGRVTGCLDTSGLAGAPTGQLPCDLVPPGRQL